VALIDIRSGNLFTSELQTLVNTVNCVGIMGAGVAYEFRLRYPAMYDRYATLCAEKRLEVGKLWLYTRGEPKWVLNFPTKKHWRNPSRVEYLERGLENFVGTYRERAIESAAFPVLGASHGGIDQEESIRIMERHLSRCDIPIEIYRHDPAVSDDLFVEFRTRLLSRDRDELARIIGLRKDVVKKLRQAVERPDIATVGQLIRVKGIGPVSLEKTFRFLVGSDDRPGSGQRALVLPK